jgi:hypothetical protein
VFCSYSHSDETFRNIFDAAEELEMNQVDVDFDDSNKVPIIKYRHPQKYDVASL